MDAKKIKEFRRKLKLSQVKLAELLGVQPQTVINYEKGGKIPPNKIALLNKILLDGGHNEDEKPLEVIISSRILKETNEKIDQLIKKQKIIIEEISILFKMVRDINATLTINKHNSVKKS